MCDESHGNTGQKSATERATYTKRHAMRIHARLRLLVPSPASSAESNVDVIAKTYIEWTKEFRVAWIATDLHAPASAVAIRLFGLSAVSSITRSCLGSPRHDRVR